MDARVNERRNTIKVVKVSMQVRNRHRVSDVAQKSLLTYNLGGKPLVLCQQRSQVHASNFCSVKIVASCDNQSTAERRRMSPQILACQSQLSDHIDIVDPAGRRQSLCALTLRCPMKANT